jgi:putative SOS response-associated peptidase YedK
MCGRVVQSSSPLRYAFVDGMNVRDSRVSNYPPRWNAAPGQELLVIRRNHATGQVLLDPLPPLQYARWLGDEADPHDLLRPFPSEAMRMWPISTRVNKPENDDASILDAIELPAVHA